MRKSVASVMTLSLILGAGALILSGCGNSEEQADKDAQAQLDKAAAERAAATTSDQMATVLQEYETVSRNPGVSQRMKIILEGDLAQCRVDVVSKKVSDLRAKELEILRTINDIEQMGLQVSGAQNTIASLRKSDPSAQIKDLKDKEDAINNPGVSDVDAKIKQLTDAINKNKSDTDAARQTASKGRDQAESIVRQSEAESGDAQVGDVVKISDLRKGAADSDSQADLLASKLALLNVDLDAANEQKASLQGNIKQLDIQIESLQSGWKSIQDQITALRGIEAKIIGTESSTGECISARAADLQKMMADAGDERIDVKNELDKAIEEFGQAERAANTYRGDLMREHSSNTVGDPDAPIWKDAMETLHPRRFALQKAAAMEMRATVVGWESGLSILIDQMMAGYQTTAPGGKSSVKMPGLSVALDKQATSVDMPKSLADLKRLPKPQEDVGKAFQDALAQYFAKSSGGTDMGQPAKDRNMLALQGHAATNRAWAEYCRLIGSPDAAKHYADAKSDLAALQTGSQPPAEEDTSALPTAAPAVAPADSNASIQPADASATSQPAQ